ncbi:hypothetical protein DC3_47980 [Deinococcus cellulosilyticus NBRC 106333 = KACC 11606]|uniref:Uncharacterized protein n=1 Tax=Deinococcus cellulosilyticus (strain DSM 18568 / NBRC 106333 / KACC 11606 / 5516J-15) TaxID=1223518 RepID=A0A511N8I9_DEIC1|nr:hypothetical protein DC3_47980 [Deinococcus cellulosilyticus NBRC 106333 = KACC 11606]
MQTANTSRLARCTDLLKTDFRVEVSRHWHLRNANQLALAQLEEANRLLNMWKVHQERLSDVDLSLEDLRSVVVPEALMPLLQKADLRTLHRRKGDLDQMQSRLVHLTASIEEHQVHLQALTRWMVLQEELGQQGFGHRMKLLLPQYRAEHKSKQTEMETLQRELQPFLAKLGATTLEQGWQGCHTRLQSLQQEKDALHRERLTIRLTPEEQQVLKFHRSQCELYQAAFEAREILERHDALLRDIQQKFPHISSLTQAQQEFSAARDQVAGLAVALRLLDPPNQHKGFAAPVFPKTQHSLHVFLQVEPAREDTPELTTEANDSVTLQHQLLQVLAMRLTLLAHQDQHQKTETVQLQAVTELDALGIESEVLHTERSTLEVDALDLSSDELLSSAPSAELDLDPVFLDPSEGQGLAFTEQVESSDDHLLDEAFLQPVQLFEPVQPIPEVKTPASSHQPGLWDSEAFTSPLALFFEVEEVEDTGLFSEDLALTESPVPMVEEATRAHPAAVNGSVFLLDPQTRQLFDGSRLLTPGWLSQLQQAQQITAKALQQASNRLNVLEEIVRHLQHVPVKHIVHVPTGLRSSLNEDLHHLRQQAAQRQQVWQTLFEKRKSILQDIQECEARVSDFGTLDLLKKQMAELQEKKGPLTATQKTILARKQKALSRLDNQLQVHWKPGCTNHQQACLDQQKKLEHLRASAKTLQVALESCMPSEQDILLLKYSLSQLKEYQQAFEKIPTFQLIQMALDALIEYFPGTSPHRWQVLQNHLQEEVQGLTHRMEVLTPRNHMGFEPLRRALWQSPLLDFLPELKQAGLECSVAHSDLDEMIHPHEILGPDVFEQNAQGLALLENVEVLDGRSELQFVQVSPTDEEHLDGLEVDPDLDLPEPWDFMDGPVLQHDPLPEFQDLEFETIQDSGPEEVKAVFVIDLWDLDDETGVAEPASEVDDGRLTTTRIAEQRAADLALRHDVSHAFDFLAEALDLKIIGKRVHTLQKLIEAGHSIEAIELAYRTRLLVSESHHFWYSWKKYGELRATPHLLSWDHALKFVACFHGLPDMTEIELTMQAILDLHADHPWFRGETSACFVLIHLIRNCPPHIDMNVYVHHLLEAM